MDGEGLPGAFLHGVFARHLVVFIVFPNGANDIGVLGRLTELHDVHEFEILYAAVAELRVQHVLFPPEAECHLIGAVGGVGGELEVKVEAVAFLVLCQPALDLQRYCLQGAGDLCDFFLAVAHLTLHVAAHAAGVLLALFPCLIHPPVVLEWAECRPHGHRCRVVGCAWRLGLQLSYYGYADEQRDKDAFHALTEFVVFVFATQQVAGDVEVVHLVLLNFLLEQALNHTVVEQLKINEAVG